jgi:DNA polymerase epsilon subunit 2
LLGATGRKIVFGMMTRNSMGQLILEDLNNTVVLDVTNCKPEEGLYTDHCMVLADGELRQGTFVVFSISMPPLEEARTTLATFPNVDLFGGAPDQSLRSEIEMYQQSAEDTMFVVLSDVWLDKPGCMAKLEQLFEGYKDIVPTAFIFMGNYMSRPLSQTADVARLQTAVAGLARLIVKFKSLAIGSRWIFSRGPADGGGPLVYPQFELPDFFVQTLKQRLPNVTFTTNPFRLRWCNVRMVFFRENLISKLRRHALFPKLLLEGNPPELLVRTLLEQSHLCPVPQSICPLYWNLDQAMHLYPIPDVLVLGDSYDQYVVRERDPAYIACNPGSFGADASFVVVRPSTLEVEESRIPDEGEEEVPEDMEQEGQDRAAPPEQEREEQIEAEEREAEDELEEDARMDEGEEDGEGGEKELAPTQLLPSDEEGDDDGLPPKDKMEMDD